MLDLVGLAAEVEKDSQPLEGFFDCTSDGEVLGFSDLPKSFKQKYGACAMGVKRTTLNLKLKNMLISMGVEVREGWELEDLEESADSVTAHFKGGRSVTGSFVIGGDGIKAASRKILLSKQGLVEGLPLFSGLTQVSMSANLAIAITNQGKTGGFSPTPPEFRGKPYMRNFYGDSVHMIAYPVSPDVTSWALTLPERSGAEAGWGLITTEQMDDRKQKLLVPIGSWKDQSARGLVQSATRMIKFGLFDREEMQPDQWHTPRCVLGEPFLKSYRTSRDISRGPLCLEIRLLIQLFENFSRRRGTPDISTSWTGSQSSTVRVTRVSRRECADLCTGRTATISAKHCRTCLRRRMTARKLLLS